MSLPALNEISNFNQPLSVTQVNLMAKELIESCMHSVWIEGEVSNLRQPSSGHRYFTLKDQSAQLSCVMFKTGNQQIKLKDGMQINIRGKVSLYTTKGTYQLIVNHVSETGIGILQQAFTALYQRLKQEGLFDSTHKKPIPIQAKNIGIVTSQNAAALQDILAVLSKRWPLLKVSIFPCSVQGNTASTEIIQALNIAENTDHIELIIITRGGGSLEDLWCFNDEKLARKIFACTTPIISAIGHEIDFTIADYVADIRAPTPSAAAEIAVPDQKEVVKHLNIHLHSLTKLINQKIDSYASMLNTKKHQLRHPSEHIENCCHQLILLSNRLMQAQQKKQNFQYQQHMQNTIKLWAHTPSTIIQIHRQTLKELHRRLNQSIEHTQHQSQQKLTNAVSQLNSLSPLETLTRGYSIITKPNKSTPLTKPSELKVGDYITCHLAKGKINCIVDKI